MYFELYDFLNERACRLGCSEKEAIQSVLFGQSTYLEKKDQIQDKEIRKDLKKIGQWKKQFFTNPSDIPQIKNHVKEIAFCTLWRSQMRFRAVALRSITAARF